MIRLARLLRLVKKVILVSIDVTDGRTYIGREGGTAVHTQTSVSLRSPNLWLYCDSLCSFFFTREPSSTTDSCSRNNVYWL